MVPPKTKEKQVPGSEFTAIWNRIGALLPTYMHLARSRMYMLWSYWSWWHGTSNYTNTKTSPGSWNYKKNIHEYRQCLFSFSWELQTSLSLWSMIYFLCVFFSESVKHREFSWFMSSWWLRLYPETQTLQWICGWGFFERDTEMDSIYHFTSSIFERTYVFPCVFSHAALQVE